MPQKTVNAREGPAEISAGPSLALTLSRFLQDGILRHTCSRTSYPFPFQTRVSSAPPRWYHSQTGLRARVLLAS